MAPAVRANRDTPVNAEEELGRTIRELTKAFQRPNYRGLLTVTNPARASSDFNWLIMSNPLNHAMLLGKNEPPDAHSINEWADQAVSTLLAAYSPTALKETAPTVTDMDDLIDALNDQRSHVFAAIDGLTEAQLSRSVLPSGWSCLGMLKHLALADEHYWFRSIIDGQPLDGFFPVEPNGDWTVGGGESAESIVAMYRHEITEANRVLAAVEETDAPAQRDPRWDQWGVDYPTVRSILLHMIVETACHAGHLDAARELLDGKQWLVL